VHHIRVSIKGLYNIVVMTILGLYYEISLFSSVHVFQGQLPV